MLRYLPLILKNSVRNRRRSALTVASIAASLCLLGLMFAIYRAFYFSEPRPGQELRLFTIHRVSLTQPLPLFYRERIRQLPGVRDLTVYQWFGGTYRDARDARNRFARFAVEPDKFFRVRPEVAMPEEQKLAFQRERTACIATRDLVERFHWPLGERITIIGDVFPVNLELKLVGVLDDPSAVETMFFSYEYLRESLALTSLRRDMVGAFQILAESAEAVPRVARAIDQLFENSPAQTKTETEQAFGLSFIGFLGNVKMFLLSICGAVTFTILLVSANTMAMSVRERVREIGVLKTLGYSPAAILYIVLGEAAVIAVIGGAIGILLASGLTAVVRAAPGTFSQQLKTLTITPGVAALSLAAAALIGLASALIPAWAAARTSILDALRTVD